MRHRWLAPYAQQCKIVLPLAATVVKATEAAAAAAVILTQTAPSKPKQISRSIEARCENVCHSAIMLALSNVSNHPKDYIKFPPLLDK